MTQNNWMPISTAPVGATILLTNESHPEVVCGYGEWFKAPMPRWISCNPDGVGRFKPTHWMPLPDGVALRK